MNSGLGTWGVMSWRAGPLTDRRWHAARMHGEGTRTSKMGEGVIRLRDIL